jgi:VWFA-related protein
VVDSPAQADFVFCLCSQYREMRIPPEMQRRLNVPAILRVWTQASVVSVERYLKTPHDPKALTEAAFWRSDSQTIEAGEQSGNENEKDKKKRKEKKDSNPNPPGGSVPGAVVNGQPVMLRPEALPYDLVKRFIKRWPAFAATISAQPKPQPAVAASPSETPRPKMATDPLAPPANDTPPKTEAAPPDSSALRIETALVIVPVMAMDKEGKYLPGLKAGDFEVYEDGVKQEISDFGSAETPFHVALVLDVSGSTRFKLEDIQDAAMSFVDQLRPQDRVMVISFDHQVRVDTEFTNERDKLMRAILRTRPGGATRLQDALDLTLTERLNKIQGRKAIVVFTDGVDNTSWLASWQDVTARVEESGVIVYPVRYDTLPDVTALPRMSPLPPNVKVVRVVGQDKEEYERAVRSLKNLASVSGGRYYDVATIADTKQAFANIAEELRRYYWLGYYPANTARDGRYRKIRVTVNRPEVVVRARDGYRTTTGEGKQ